MERIDGCADEVMGEMAARDGARPSLAFGKRIGETKGGYLNLESVARPSTISSLFGQGRLAG